LAHRAAEIQDPLGDNFGRLNKLIELSKVQLLKRIGEDKAARQLYRCILEEIN
jgi:hypothetical protein